MEFDNRYNLFKNPAKTKINSKQKFNLDDAELLGYIATDVTHTCATNGRHYWYYVFEDIKECDFIVFLFNRNGLYPRLHYSHYLNEHRFNPVLRMRSRYVKKNSDVKSFVSLIKASHTILQHDNICHYMVQAKKDFSQHTK